MIDRRKMKFNIKDIKLALEGNRKIDWAESKMPVLRLIRRRFKKEILLKNRRIAC